MILSAHRMPRTAAWLPILGILAGCSAELGEPFSWPDSEGIFHVNAGEEIQPALDAAAAHEFAKTVRVHDGVYRPSGPRQALIRFNAQHDGITLEADGDVELTAANPEVADPDDRGYPAIVNHVVYFGDGISRKTVLRGFRITGANGFVTRSTEPPIESAEAPAPQQKLFFHLDGGEIKIFGRSYPTILHVEVRDNATRLCGAGVSVQHEGSIESSVLFRHCVFRENRCPATGVAIDLLGGSVAVVENCLFVANVGNTGMEEVADRYGLKWSWTHGSGAITVFPGSRAEVRRSTFTGNWNGVDDRGHGSMYEDCIFWRNVAGDGSRPGRPYELDVADAGGVRGCFVGGDLVDLQDNVDAEANELHAPDPHFDSEYRPQAEIYADVGYRPVSRGVH